MSPVSNTLRIRVRRFPALLSCTAVDWFHEWPQEALQSVSLQFIKDLHGIDVSYSQNFRKIPLVMLGNYRTIICFFPYYN